MGGSSEETTAKKFVTFRGDDYNFFKEKIGRHPSVAAPSDTNPSDATEGTRSVPLADCT